MNKNDPALNRVAALIEPDDQREFYRLRDRLAAGDDPPTKDEAIALSIDWFNARKESSCGRSDCRDVFTRVDNGSWPIYGRFDTSTCQFCGRSMERGERTVEPEMVTRWELVGGWPRSMKTYRRTVEFPAGTSEDAQRSYIAWMKENDNPGNVEWNASRAGAVTWKVSTTYDSAE